MTLLGEIFPWRRFFGEAVVLGIFMWYNEKAEDCEGVFHSPNANPFCYNQANECERM